MFGLDALELGRLQFAFTIAFANDRHVYSHVHEVSARACACACELWRLALSSVDRGCSKFRRI